MKKLSVFLLVSVALFSCSKKDDPAPTTPTQLLSQHTWLLTSLASTDPDFESTGLVLLDSEWAFKPDKSFSIVASVTGINVTFTGTWSLSADEKVVTVNSNYMGTAATSVLQIISLTATSLEVKEEVSGMTNTYTFTKK